ncbi:phospholipase-like, aminotransferase-like mobile domain protein [Tanacetum coccineum]
MITMIFPHFGRHEFCLISGFKFGWISFCNFRDGDITFRDRVFSEKIGEYVKNIDLLSLIEDEVHFTSLSDSDSIRVCLLLSLEVIFRGHDLGSAVNDVFLRMVEDLEDWNEFPWVEHMSRELYAAIRNVNSNHKQAHHKALEINPNFVPTYSLSGFVLCFKILKESREDVSGPSIFHFKNGSILGNFFPSLMILPKEIKSLKARVYKLETIINHKDSTSGKQCDLGDKYWSDQDGEPFFKYSGSTNPSANKDVVNDLVDALDDLVYENGVVEVDKYLSQDDFLKAQKLEAEKNRVAEKKRLRCGTNKRRYVDVLMPPIEEDTAEKFPWCTEIVVARHFWDSLIGLDDEHLGWLVDDIQCRCYATDEIYPLAWRDVEQVFIPINEANRHWSLAQFHIQSRNVTFYDSQKTYDPEFHPWYVKMRSCLESKLHVVLQQTGVFASKGIDPTNYSIKFTNEQNVPKQGGVFGDCRVFVCQFLYRLAHGIPLDVEDPI